MTENDKINLPPEIDDLGVTSTQAKPSEVIISPISEGMAGGSLDQYPLSTVVYGIA